MKRQLLLLTVFIALMLQGCSQSAVVVNENIDASLRKTIDANNRMLTDALWKNKSRDYKRLATDRFSEKEAEGVVAAVSPIYFKPGISRDYTIMDEFYAPEGGTGEVTLTSEKHGYSIRFFNNTPQYYVSVIKIHPNDQQHYLVAAVYHKVGEDWLLDNVFPVRYAMLGKSAADMLAMAKQWDKKGFPIDAYIHAHGARNLVLHAGDHISYSESDEIEDYRESLARGIMAEYGEFPIMIAEILTKPKILDFDMAFHENGLYPAVHYVSNVPKNDTLGQELEYEYVRNYMKKNFTGLAANQGFVFYRRFTETPPESGTYYFSNAYVDENAKVSKSK